MSEKITKEHIISDLKKMGIQSGDLLNLKVALSSIGMVDGGAGTLIEALLDVIGLEGTIVSDAFVKLSVRPHMVDGEIQDDPVGPESPSVFGAVVNAMINHPNSVRSRHPIKKFCAIGGMAESLMLKHTEIASPNDVLRKMTHGGGKNLKIGPDAKVEGVGTTHVVMEDLKICRWMERRGVCIIDNNGKKFWWEDNSLDCCALGLSNLLEHYDKSGSVLQEGVIGAAPAKLTSMERTYRIEKELIEKDATILHCSRPSCLTCRCMWKSSKQSPIFYALKHVVKGDLENAKLALRHFKARFGTRLKIVCGYEERN